MAEGQSGYFTYLPDPVFPTLAVVLASLHLPSSLPLVPNADNWFSACSSKCAKCRISFFRRLLNSQVGAERGPTKCFLAQF